MLNLTNSAYHFQDFFFGGGDLGEGKKMFLVSKCPLWYCHLLFTTPSHQHHLTMLTEHNFQIFIFKLLKISTSDLSLLSATKSYIKLMISSIFYKYPSINEYTCNVFKNVQSTKFFHFSCFFQFVSFYPILVQCTTNNSKFQLTFSISIKFCVKNWLLSCDAELQMSSNVGVDLRGFGNKLFIC